MKQHEKRVQFSRSVHRIQQTSNKKITFITRTQKLVSPIIQQNSQNNLSARSTQRTSTPIRRVINTVHIKTQSDMNEQQEMKGSLFKFVQSNEFQTLKYEEKQKTNTEIQFSLEGVMKRKEITMRKSIFHGQYNTKCQFNEENNLNTKAFIKKILQLILGTQRNDITLNNDSVFSDKDKYKTQLSSPRITFTNHLSTIPLMNQQTQLKTMGTGIYQMMDNIVDKIERPIAIPIPLPKMKIQITICNPEQLQIKQEFTIPEYCVQKQEILSPLTNHQNEIVEYSDKPQHVLKQALSFLAQQKKSTQSKFSQSILKIVGIKEDNQKESQTFNSLKTRRFCKLYMQNKIQRTFLKLEENILLNLQLLGDSNSAIFIKTMDSPSTSRILSSQTNHIGNLNFNFENGTQQPTIYFEQQIINYRINIQLSDKLFTKFQINIDENNIDEIIYNIELDERTHQSKQPLLIIECPGLYEIINRNYLNFIISNLDDNSRNILLSDQSILKDQTMLLKTLDQMRMSQCHNIINYKLSRLSRLDKIQIAYRIYEKYNEILTGIFEDTHEINNMDQEYEFLEFEAPQKQKQTFNNIFSKAIAPAMRIIHKNQQQQKNTTDQSPRNKQKYASNSPRTNNQMVQSTGQRITTKTPSLLEAQSTQISRKQTDSPQQSTQQEELSIKNGKEESSNVNTTQSNNNIKKKSINNPVGSQTNISNKESNINNDRRERRNAALAFSMTKHSLQMRTHIAEAERRRVQPLNDIVRLLIEEQKFNELVEIFGNNPNIMINERSQDTNTYLITAAQTGSVEIVQLLLFKGAGVNLQNAEGDTALHRAIAFNFYNVADLLIQNGATVIKNNKGLTPWQLAQK